MMRSTKSLPRNYVPSQIIDFDNNQKLNRNLMIAAIAAFAGLFLLGNFYLPIYLLGLNEAAENLPVPLIALKVGIIIMVFIFYSLIHEKMRGLLMKRFSGVNSQLEFKGASAYSKSSGYFAKRDFRIISLGPVLIFAILIFVVTLLLPMDWFWVGFIAQILNLAGSVKDIYSAWQGLKQPDEVLVQDSGLQQTFYTPSLEPQPKEHVSRKKAEAAASTQKQMNNIYRKKKKK